MVITAGNRNGAENVKKNKNTISKEIIVDTALRLIEERGGSKGVTLRDIAKELGCAHTNLYNYHDSLDEIFWEAIAKVLIKEIDFLSDALNSKAKNEEKLNKCLECLVDFSMKYPGWFKLVWLDSLSGQPSAEVNKIIMKPGEGFIELIMETSSSLSKDEAATVANILHSYLHGELCKWVNGRSFISDEEIRKEIITNLKNIYKALTK